MGTPIPPINPPIDPGPPGTECSVCWGPGKPFGPGPTPQFLKVNISGVEKAPGWTAPDGQQPDGDFILEQVIGTPCTWLDPDFPFEDFFQYITGKTRSIFFSSQGVNAFGGFWDYECQTVMENQIEFPFINGTLTLLNAIT